MKLIIFVLPLQEEALGHKVKLVERTSPSGAGTIPKNIYICLLAYRNSTPNRIDSMVFKSHNRIHFIPL